MPTIQIRLIQKPGFPTNSRKIADVTIRIYDAAGRIVRTLFVGHQTAGYYLSRSEAVYWDGKNELGEQVASGIYICELATPTFKQTRQLVILK